MDISSINNLFIDVIRDNISLKDVWDIQEAFEKKFFKFKGLEWGKLTLEEKRFWSKEFYTHIVIELSEMMNKMQYKMHRDYIKEINEFNIKENLIDSFKFLLGMAQLWFNDPYEFIAMFKDKTAVVDKRFQFEKLTNLIKTQGSGIVIIDIDGVLADLEADMKKIYNHSLQKMQFYISAKNNFENLLFEYKDALKDYKYFKTTREVKEKFPELHEKFKDLYRKSNRHRYLSVIDGAKDFMKELKSLGYKIVIISARPFEKYNNLWADTMQWLENNNIPYDALYFDNKKHEKILEVFKNNLDSIKFIVDDSKEICEQVSRLNIKSYNIDHKNITFQTILEDLKNERSNNHT